jgi:hypothetical protein
MMMGFGNDQFSMAFYIANRPDIDSYQDLNHLHSLRPGEIDHIVEETGNHWRKIFNVSAKFAFQYLSEHSDEHELPESWQAYRDTLLYQKQCPIALLFSPPQFTTENVVHIVAGRTYARELGLEDLIWLDEKFAMNQSQRLIVCPYLDYRQLSNARINQLSGLVSSLSS